jgi:Icc protein
MTSNPQQFLEALQGGNVPLCLSGHIHRVEDLRFGPLRMVCSGAVSAAQWRGPDHETQPGFGVVDCYDDGTVQYEYKTFGWVF